MPIDFNALTADGRPPVRPGTVEHAVLAVLVGHSSEGLTPSEIAAETTQDIQQGSLGPTLRRLADRDLVRHDSPYWAAKADLTAEEVPPIPTEPQTRPGGQLQGDDLAGLLGSEPEQYEQWTGGAVDPIIKGDDPGISRGDVGWIGQSESSAAAEDQHRGQPIVVLSDDRHPQSAQLVVGIPLSTADLPESVALDPANWTAGRPPANAVAVPWAPQTLPQRVFTATIGAIEHDRVNRFCVQSNRYTAPIRSQ